jgi:branched-chain amino acid transport system ATP-binding protein
VSALADPIPVARPAELLRVSALHAFYGESHILHGVDLSVGTGELVTLLGRNGSGRTTTLKAILGLVDRRTGSVMVNGRETIAMPTHRIVHLGLGYCPEERGIFASLTAEENLTILPTVGSGGMSVDEIYAMFPNLAERRRSPGSRLSGGEQQMLAMARILRTGARLLLLDEITEGLAPVIVQALGRAVRTLKERGYTVVLVEQNFRFVAPLADRHFLLERGRVVGVVDRTQIEGRMESLQRFLGV